jgi:hypothetical protein
MSDEEERPVPAVPSRLAGVLSGERRTECMASGTLQFDGDVVIDGHTRVPRGPASSSTAPGVSVHRHEHASDAAHGAQYGSSTTVGQQRG